MQNTKNLGLIEHHSAYSVFKRIANLVLVVAVLVLAINFWSINTEQSRNWYEKQANQLGRSLSQQVAGTLSLAKKPLADFNNQLKIVLGDKHVAGVALFDARGQLLSSQGQEASILTVLREEESLPLVFVEEISRNGQLYGYLRLQLDEAQVMRYHDDYQDQLFKQVQTLMLISALAALLLTRGFYKLRQVFISKNTQTDRFDDSTKPEKVADN